MFKFICLALLVSYAAAGDVKFTDCAHGEVTSLDLSGCSGDHCIIHKGKSFTLKTFFIANQDSEKLEIKISAIMNNIEVPVPGVDKDGCKHTTCPLKKGQKYELDYSLIIPTILPNLKTVTTASLVGDHGVVACGKVNTEVVA
uniref:Group 2 allergen Blo t 2 isoform 4 n=1 Tax=Blomia tropicalis TaxID=40697 RepID=A6XEP1_BLOTA|nr:group 2 allergen Blo t 2 isoform 4 [Blomia tropicalis]